MMKTYLALQITDKKQYLRAIKDLDRNCENHFADELFIMQKNKKIYIVAATYPLLEVWKSLGKKYPNRFINVGVAEQIMKQHVLDFMKLQTFAYTIAAFII